MKYADTKVTELRLGERNGVRDGVQGGNIKERAPTSSEDRNYMEAFKRVLSLH